MVGWIEGAVPVTFCICLVPLLFFFIYLLILKKWLYFMEEILLPFPHQIQTVHTGSSFLMNEWQTPKRCQDL